MFSITSRSGRTIILRPLQDGDQQILFDYAKLIESEDTYILLNPAEPVTWSEESDYLQTCINKISAGWQLFFLAFHQNRLIGSAQLTKQGRRKMHCASFGISLLPDYRRDGIGKAIAHFMLEKAKELNLTLITLEVFAKNETAIKLYQSLGFVEYGRLPKGLLHSNGHQDAIYMFKPLK